MFVLTAFGMLSVLLSLPVRLAHAQTVFQAAGPTAESIQATVELFRAALGATTTATLGHSPAVTARSTGTAGVDRHDRPGHTVRRVPQHPWRPVHHAGEGPFAGAPVGGAQGGLADLFNNPEYADIFKTFSSPRLFTPVGSRLVNGAFFLPGSGGRDASDGDWLRRGLHRR